MFVAALRERRDAAGQRSAVRGQIHHGPGPATETPWIALFAAFETHSRLGSDARRRKGHAELRRQRLRLFEIAPVLLIHAFIKRLVWASVADRLTEEHEALEI